MTRLAKIELKDNIKQLKCIPSSVKVVLRSYIFKLCLWPSETGPVVLKLR